MTSLRSSVIRCCGFCMALTVAVLVGVWGGVVTLNDRQALMVLTVALILVCLGPVAYLGGLLAGRLRRDVNRLQLRVRGLAVGDFGEDLAPMAFREAQSYADEMNRVVAALREQQERLNDGATRDPLTGLPNRRLFREVLMRETKFAERTGWPLALVMMDIDHFKKLNDTYGHPAGDHVLKHTARRLSSLVRGSDVVARYGGEEFVIVFPGTAAAAAEIAEQLRLALRCDLITFEGRQLRLTASFGVADTAAGAVPDADTLLARADEALYLAKNGGRDRVVVAADAGATPAAGARAAQGDAIERPPRLATTEEPVDRDAMALMGSIFSILALIPDDQRVAQDVTQQFAAALHCSSARLFVWDEAHRGLRPLSSSVIEERDRLERIHPSAALEQWCAALLGSDGVTLSGDETAEVVVQPRGDDGTVEIYIPLTAYGAFFGVIEATTRLDGPELTSRQHAVLTALGAIGAMALRSCDVYSALEDRWIGLIEALCRAIHSQDAFKRDHGERVADISVILARALGQQDREQLQMIRVAGVVHDIGKVGLPAALFQRKGRLRKAERERMQQHCRMGAEILTKVPGMERLAEIVRQHHEHYDGGGYPQGLAGSEILIESRIIAVADAYDAMTSPRPFRAALDHDEAVDRIRRASATQFDPAVVQIFLSLFESEEHKELLLWNGRPALGQGGVSGENRCPDLGPVSAPPVVRC